MCVILLSAMSATDSGIWTILAVPEILVCLVSLLQDKDETISKEAACTLVNISADKYGPREMLNLDKDYCPPLQTRPKSIVDSCLKHILNKHSHLADQCCMILCNLSRTMDGSKQTYELLENSEFKIEDIINVFTKLQYNIRGANLNYLGPWLSNMTQDKRFRKLILDNINIVNNLMTYTTYQESSIRKGGIIGEFQITIHRF